MSYSPDPDTRMAMRIEGGPERFSGALDKAQEALARNSGGNRYATLQDTFGTRDDGSDPLDGWDDENLSEMLRCTIGAAEDFASEYDVMTEEERTVHFPDTLVAELVGFWAQYGKELGL